MMQVAASRRCVLAFSRGVDLDYLDIHARLAAPSSSSEGGSCIEPNGDC